MRSAHPLAGRERRRARQRARRTVVSPKRSGLRRPRAPRIRQTRDSPNASADRPPRRLASTARPRKEEPALARFLLAPTAAPGEKQRSDRKTQDRRNAAEAAVARVLAQRPATRSRASAHRDTSP